LKSRDAVESVGLCLLLRCKNPQHISRDPAIYDLLLGGALSTGVVRLIVIEGEVNEPIEVCRFRN